MQQWQNCEMEVACSGGSLYYKIKGVNIFCFSFPSRKYLIFALVFLKAIDLGEYDSICWMWCLYPYTSGGCYLAYG